MKIAILYICTGSYSVFWDAFHNSVNKYFLPQCEKYYFVFTDSQILKGDNRTTFIYKKCEGFPNDSLFRFRMFLQIENELEEFDYVFFLNANMLCIDYISSEEILPQDKDLLGVISPGYYCKNPRSFPYERNKLSRAYIPYQKKRKYYYLMGGFNGGKTQAYIKLIKECCDNIESDYRNGIIALYHDESHINKFFFQHENSVKILSPIYGYPEGWKSDFMPKIIIRDKVIYSKEFDKNRMSIYERVKRKILRYYRFVSW